MRSIMMAAVGLVFAASPAAPQSRPPAEGGFTASLGQPRAWKWTVGTSAGWHLAQSDGMGVLDATAGLQRDLLNPLLSLAAVHGELYLGVRGAEPDGGARARVLSPFARFGIGADFNMRDGRTDLLLSTFHPVRRGGLFRDGTVVRADYLPTRDHFLSVGLERPVFRRIPMGAMRPLADRVPLPRPQPLPLPRPDPLPGVDDALADARRAAASIRRLTLPFLEHDGRDQRAVDAAVAADVLELKRVLADGMSPEEHVRRFHGALDRVFSIAAAPGPLPHAQESTAEGRLLALKFREVLLDDVLLPYNRRLGQAKAPDGLLGLGAQARGVFMRWLHVEAPAPLERAQAAIWVFNELLDIIEENRAATLAQWRDSRFVWLPLQYALLPEQHDSQHELDALIERALGLSFTDGNFVSWVVNEQFQYQLNRTIALADEYHVLWTHDFRGHDANGDPDEMSFRHVLHSYMRAMTERVRAYDATGRFPTYIILLDEWFYQVNAGRLWLSLLEDPTRHQLQLPPEWQSWEAAIREAQDSLRAAIAGSVLLQAQSRQYGDAWLRNLIKVHVNITNPADPSFWSRGVASPLPLPDNAMRDHRKVVFYDLTEEDPYRGAAMYTGAGVGEHYANLSWEDRSLLVRGPAVLGLKQAARELLLNQGMAPDRIPFHLQPRPRAADYDERVRAAIAAGHQPLRALEMHNRIGFGEKHVNVAKAVIYTLMPPGSVIKIPDSLWNSGFWGSALLGCSLRGVRVVLIAPAAPNAPADFFGTLERSRDLLSRLLTAERVLAPEIERAGGLLRIGLFAPELEVTDIPGKVRAVQRTFGEQPWLHELFGFPPRVYDGLADLADMLEGLAMRPGAPAEFEYDPRPKLHLKANYFASREAWSIMTRPEWSAASFAYAQIRIAQVQARSAALVSFDTYPDAFADDPSGMTQDWFADLDPTDRERVVFYIMMGSHNQNYRSMVVDGEVGFVISQWPAIIAYLDLITMMGQTRWIQQPAELTGLLPEDTGLKRRITRWIRLML